MLEFDGQQRIMPEEILRLINPKIPKETAFDSVKIYDKYTLTRINDLFIFLECL